VAELRVEASDLSRSTRTTAATLVTFDYSFVARPAMTVRLLLFPDIGAKGSRICADKPRSHASVFVDGPVRRSVRGVAGLLERSTVVGDAGGFRPRGASAAPTCRQCERRRSVFGGSGVRVDARTSL
jgi:hypothetical protein